MNALLWTISSVFLYRRFGANSRFTECPKDVIKVFRQLQILNLQFNSCFADLGTPALVLMTVETHVACLILSLKFQDKFPLAIYSVFVAWSFTSFFMEGIMFTMLGHASHYSRTLMTSWTEVVGSKSRKRLKSMRPLGVQIGNIYVVHRTTVLSIFLVVANSTVQVLLLH